MEGILLLALLFAAFGAALGYAASRLHTTENPLAEQVANLLPQTQCGQCGYAGCKPYAEAIAAGEAEFNLCPPGGRETIKEIAELLGRDPKPLDESRGTSKPRAVALIDEARCIGCTLCIQACPVDAILGAAKQMHTVIDAECTGCELCLPPCPVDCIAMVPVGQDLESWGWPQPADPLLEHVA